MKAAISGKLLKAEATRIRTTFCDYCRNKGKKSSCPKKLSVCTNMCCDPTYCPYSEQ